MDVEERMPDVRIAIRERRADQLLRRSARHFHHLLEVFARRDPVAVALGQAELVFGVGRQRFFCGSKKSATFPIAALT